MKDQQEETISKLYEQLEILSEISLDLNSLEDFDDRINKAIQKIGNHTGVSRVYIFEDNPTGGATSNTFEWCNTGIDPQKDELQDIPYQIIPNWKNILFEKGRVYSENISELPQDLRAILEPQEIKSIVVYPLYKSGEFFGFIGFDECVKYKKWLRSELELLKSISGIIANTFGRRDIENQLTKAKENAERASMVKAQFLSTMSHEIRTPMNAVIGLSHLLLQEDPKPEQMQNLKILKFSAQNLLGIINDILDFNKIEAGKIILEQEDIILKDLIEGIIYSFTPKTNEKGIYIKGSIHPEVPEVVIGDQVRLTQILNNLVSNAVKFTDSGGITIYINKTRQDQSEVDLEFSVADTGIGIPENYHKQIFEEFTQAEAKISRKYGGTGLGLAITKKLLELHNSKIELESEPEKGSRFSFTITTNRVNRRPENKDKFADDDPFSLKGMKILVVEDNKVNQMVAGKFLEKWNTDPAFAENGKLALSMLDKEKFDLVLMDLQMPEMDGYETTRNIRKSDKSYRNIPIIALSASAMLQIRDKAINAGMNEFVTKPFHPKELFNKILKHREAFDDLAE